MMERDKFDYVVAIKEMASIITHMIDQNKELADSKYALAQKVASLEAEVAQLRGTGAEDQDAIPRYLRVKCVDCGRPIIIHPRNGDIRCSKCRSSLEEWKAKRGL